MMAYEKGIPHVDSDTSLEAARSQQGRAAADRLIVRSLIINAAIGLTSDQVEHISGRLHQTISARIKDLHDNRLIRDSRLRRPTRAGRPAIVWMPGKCYCFDSEQGPGKHGQTRGS